MWPVWSSQRYRRVNKVNYERTTSEEGLWPDTNQASDLLWNIVQAEQAYRHAPFLYTRPLVKGAVEALRDSTMLLESNLIPRTMLSLAFAGGPIVWKEEMDSLCTMIPNVEFQSLRQIEDCTRALKMCRHKIECVKVLDIAAHDVMARAASLNLAALIAQGIVYQRHVPQQFFQSIVEYFNQNEECGSLKALGTLGTAVAYADCLNMGEVKEIKILMEMLMDRIDVANKEKRYSLYDLHRLHPFLLWYSLHGTNPHLLNESISVREDAGMKRSHTVSTFQREVYDVLTSYMGLSCAMEQTILGISVDIAIPGKNVAVEVNGPSHFYRNADNTMLPSSDFKETIIPMVQPGWRLVHVQQNVWDILLHRKDKAEYLKGLILHGDSS